MKTGETIKIIDSEQVGTVTKILSESKVEIALENGFKISINKSKLVKTEEPIPENNFIRFKKNTITIPPMKVDLHIECILPNHSHLTNGEKIDLQLQTFERCLDAAIASGQLEITFVHGIGSGVLRKEIHKKLKMNKQIKSFSDAQYDKGATLVKIY